MALQSASNNQYRLINLTIISEGGRAPFNVHYEFAQLQASDYIIYWRRESYVFAFNSFEQLRLLIDATEIEIDNS